MSVHAANTLTARWASTVDDRQSVLSGAGVYPLLALLARYAAGPARDELLAVAPDPAGYDLDASPTTRLALGVWCRRDLPLTERWQAEVAEATRGELTGDPTVDKPVLDRWAADRTDGMIGEMPVTVEPDTLMVLASALSVVTTWAEPFTDWWPRPDAGPWQGRDLAGLTRRTSDLGALRVADTPAGPVTLLTVRGVDDVDVVLALGSPERSAAQVLPAAIGALVDGPALPVTAGPGVTVQLVAATDDRPELVVSTVRFTVEDKHDLLADAALFGLHSATDRKTGHFPGISPVPMAVSQARQSATATFSATGFEAAVVTAIAMVPGSVPPPATKQKQQVTVAVDRPFGFLAVHRPTGLVLVAGWVTDPEPYRDR